MKKLGLLMIVLAFIIAACGQKSTQSPSQPNGGDSTSGTTTPPTNNSSPADPQKKTVDIKAYFTDPQLLKLVEAQRTISYTNDNEKYQSAFMALTESAFDQQVPLWPDAKLNQVKLDDKGLLTIDVSLNPDNQLGSTGEDFAIQSLTKTFFQFPEVKSIQILKDGQIQESLMGHMSIDQPFKRP